MERNGDRYTCSCGHRGEQLAIEFRRERKIWMSENKDFALQLAVEKAESDRAMIDQLKRDLSIARNDAAGWIKRAHHFDGFIRHECEECGRGFAINEANGDGLDEPACPECGSTNSTAFEVPR